VSGSLRLACLASGGGRTILNLVRCIEEGTLSAEILGVIVSTPAAPAIERCRAVGLHVHVPPGGQDVDAWTIDTLTAMEPELVCLCGYLRLLPIPPWMIHRVINIHPALLPDFGGRGMYGQRVHEAVIESGRTESGCTVHLVDGQYDHGPTILQRRCEVHPGDTGDTLAGRVFVEECLAMPEAISWIAQGRVRVADGPVEIAAPGKSWSDAIVRPAQAGV